MIRRVGALLRLALLLERSAASSAADRPGRLRYGQRFLNQIEDYPKAPEVVLGSVLAEPVAEVRLFLLIDTPPLGNCGFLSPLKPRVLVFDVDEGGLITASPVQRLPPEQVLDASLDWIARPARYRAHEEVASFAVRPVLVAVEQKQYLLRKEVGRRVFPHFGQVGAAVAGLDLKPFQRRLPPEKLGSRSQVLEVGLALRDHDRFLSFADGLAYVLDKPPCRAKRLIGVTELAELLGRVWFSYWTNGAESRTTGCGIRA